MAIKVEYRIWEPVTKNVLLKDLINLDTDLVKNLQDGNEEVFFDLQDGKFEFELEYKSSDSILLRIYDGVKEFGKPRKELIKLKIYKDTDLNYVGKIIEVIAGEKI